VADGIASLKAAGTSWPAFSNGEAEVVRAVLENAKLLCLLDEVVGAGEMKTFKPDSALHVRAVGSLICTETALSAWCGAS
jgi:FMN phosphatase YigB (HAD superfamily)